MYSLEFGMSTRVITFGCRLNTFESSCIHPDNRDDTDVIVVNSCAVTNEASRQVRQTIRRLRRENPSARLVLTGCGADIETDQYAQMPELNTVLLNGSKFDPDLPFEDGVVGERSTALRAQDARVKIGPQTQARAHLEVQNGCDHSCTFCIIPTGRGASRSVPIHTVVSQARTLFENGHNEVVLTGVDLTSYGSDMGGNTTLGTLVGTLLSELPQLPRIRLSSLDAIEVDDRLFDLIIHEDRIMPHLHLSLQSGDNMILKRMKRRHQREDAIALCQKLKSKRPQIALGADIIAGFPTETDDMFANSLKLIDECSLDFIHAFPFSPRKGTPAERMPQVPRDIVRARAQELRNSSKRRALMFYQSLVGGAGNALVEKTGEARLENFGRVLFDGTAERGEIIRVAITSAAATHVKGTLI